MNLVLNFGLNGAKKQVTWHKPLMDFPKLLRFQGKCWEWAIYNSIGSDYELIFSQIPTYDPNYYAEMSSYEELFEWSNKSYDCCCGAAWTSFEWDHLRFCPKHKPWNQV